MRAAVAVVLLALCGAAAPAAAADTLTIFRSPTDDVAAVAKVGEETFSFVASTLATPEVIDGLRYEAAGLPVDLRLDALKRPVELRWGERYRILYAYPTATTYRMTVEQPDGFRVDRATVSGPLPAGTLRALAAARVSAPVEARRIPVGGIAFSASLAACPAPYAFPRPIDVGGVGLRVVGPGFGTVDLPARRVSPQANDWRATVDLLVVKEYLRRVDAVRSDLEGGLNTLCPLLTLGACSALPAKYRVGCGQVHDPGAAICVGFAELTRRVSQLRKDRIAAIDGTFTMVPSLTYTTPTGLPETVKLPAISYRPSQGARSVSVRFAPSCWSRFQGDFAGLGDASVVEDGKTICTAKVGLAGRVQATLSQKRPGVARVLVSGDEAVSNAAPCTWEDDWPIGLVQDVPLNGTSATFATGPRTDRWSGRIGFGPTSASGSISNRFSEVFGPFVHRGSVAAGIRLSRH